MTALGNVGKELDFLCLQDGQNYPNCHILVGFSDQMKNGGRSQLTKPKLKVAYQLS